MLKLNTFNTVFVLTLIYTLLIALRFAVNTITDELIKLICKSSTILYIELLALTIITPLIFKEIKETFFLEYFKDFNNIAEDVVMSDINHQIIDIKNAKPPEEASKFVSQNDRYTIDYPIQKSNIRSSKRSIYTSHNPMKIQKSSVHKLRSRSQFKTIHTDQVKYQYPDILDSLNHIETTKLVVIDGSKRRIQFKLNLIESKEPVILELQIQNLEYNCELTMHQHLQNILNLISSS